ncbi:hypothetical protein HD806DRAFT_522334 [Xylariaceae sp. AK1471]|nr:hypothetical protein HD806DRAFT_522334 [Xylariaceae sp. AK1471]
MHYAAWHGQQSKIRFLHSQGCRIDPAARNGKTSLRLAVEKRHLDTVKELLQLGAKMEVDEHGLSPLAYAYRTRNTQLINALKSQNGGDTVFQLSLKGIAKMKHAFYMALMKGHLDAC